VAQIPKNTEENWELQIPKVWLSSTIWAESSVKALRSMDKTNLIKKINWNYLYAKMLVNNFEYYEDVRPHIPRLSQKLKTLHWFLILVIKRVYNFILNFLKTKMKLTNNKIYFEKMSLLEAFEIVNENNANLDYKTKF